MEEYDGDELDLDEIRLGDVIYLDYENQYVVVTEVDTRNDRIYYLTTDSRDEVYSDYIDFDDLNYSTDYIYTRYEDSPSGSSSSRLTESDVEDLIDDFFADEYKVGVTCYECDERITAPSAFTSSQGV